MYVSVKVAADALFVRRPVEEKRLAAKLVLANHAEIRVPTVEAMGKIVADDEIRASRNLGRFEAVGGIGPRLRSATLRWKLERLTVDENLLVGRVLHKVTGHADNALDEKRVEARMREYDEVSAMRWLRAISEGIGNETVADAECGAHGNGRNSEGSEARVRLQVVCARDRSDKQ
jgi:hypothetical protein